MDSDAVPPSSPPPRAAATEPPSSPFFEPQRYGAFSPKSSSPPPLFSSDDSGETLDITNYQSPRFFKNKRKGAWYETGKGDSTQTTPEAKKTKISRNYDSGICMMSDNSDVFTDPPLEHKSPFPFSVDDAAEDVPESTNMTEMTEAEAAFYSMLRTGLDTNSSYYDFAGLGLYDNNIRQIGELNSVIKNLPDPGNELPAEGQYRSMVPELHIDISQNSLRRLTPSLFDLQHLTTLTMRSNHIQELPSLISQLHNLKELDVSLNKLRYLPFELTQMLSPNGKLRRLTITGNPLLERVSLERYLKWDQYVAYRERHPFKSSMDDLYNALSTIHDREALVWNIRYGEAARRCPDTRYNRLEYPGETYEERPIRMGRTLVSYFDQTGHPVKGSPVQPTSDLDDYSVIVDTARGSFGVPESVFVPPTASRVAPLLLLSAHAALAELSVDETRERLGEDVPRDVEDILAQAAENDGDQGFGHFRQCHTCKKEYIVARAEWIEFCAYQAGFFYPFMVRVCSWGCVPPQKLRPEKVLEW